MTEKKPFFPPSSRALLGVVGVLASAAVTYAKARSVQGALDDLLWVSAHRAPGDSAVIASAAYHAGHASLDYNARWGLTGYMTLGTLFVALGVVLALSALRRPANADQSR